MEIDNGVTRVLQYVGSLNIGGSQTMLMELYRKMDKTTIQFDFVIDKKNENYFVKEIESMGGKVYYLDNYAVYNSAKYKEQWRNFFKNHKEYKIIHSHVRSTASIVLKIAKEFGLTTICHSHATSNGTGIKAIIKNFLQKSIPNYADYLFGCSIDSAIWLFGEKNAKSKKCYILNNSIDSEKYRFNKVKRDEVRKKLCIEDNIVIGQVGRIENMKNHTFSLKVLKKCIETNPKYVLLIVGDGSLAEKIKSEAIELGISQNVIMLGNRSDVNELLEAMDVFIMPSIYEGLPMVLVEAQASSLPCVISNNISAGFLIDELIYKMSLAEPYDNWAKTINEVYSKKRVNRKEEIEKSGFDIKGNAVWLENFYLKCQNNKEENYEKRNSIHI